MVLLSEEIVTAKRFVDRYAGNVAMDSFEGNKTALLRTKLWTRGDRITSVRRSSIDSISRRGKERKMR